jgi:hypothetical protein
MADYCPRDLLATQCRAALGRHRVGRAGVVSSLYLDANHLPLAMGFVFRVTF